MELEGKIAIVTGASSGIGLAISEALAKQKVKVVMAARRLPLLSENAEKFSNLYNTDVDAVETDMTREKDVLNLLNYTVEKYGPPNILINSAGVFRSGSLKTTTNKQHDFVFNLNYTAKINFIREALKYMKEGVILNVSSGAGTTPYAKESAYCSSMAALNMATQVLDLELKPSIRAYAIAPGLVDTEMARREFAEFNMTEKEWAAALKPKDVAERAIDIIRNAENYDKKNNDSVIVPVESGLKA